MDLDHMKELVDAAIAECEALNDTGPRYDELEAFVLEAAAEIRAAERRRTVKRLSRPEPG